MWEGDVWVAVRAARAGAAVVRSGMSQELEAEMKGVVDPVTRIDREAEDAILGMITHHFPDDRILAEEGRDLGGWDSGRVWIVDPLDGTVNFVHNIPQSAVSVALWEDGSPLVGVVYDVSRDEEFVAVKGGGATLNGDSIAVSETADLNDSLILTGFPYDQRDHPQGYLAIIELLLEQSRAVRVIGSAALDLAWVAAGRGDGYTEHGGAHGLKPWDLAAGSLLVTEAGGMFSDHQGRTNLLQGAAFVASNGKIHEELRSAVVATLPRHLT